MKHFATSVVAETDRYKQIDSITLLGVVISVNTAASNIDKRVIVKVFREANDITCIMPEGWQLKQGDYVYIERRAEEGFRIPRLFSYTNQYKAEEIKNFIDDKETNLSTETLRQIGLPITQKSLNIVSVPSETGEKYEKYNHIYVKTRLLIEGTKHQIEETSSYVKVNDSNGEFVNIQTSGTNAPVEEQYIQERKRKLEELRNHFGESGADIIKDINNNEYRRVKDSYELYDRKQIEEAYNKIFEGHAKKELEDITQYLEQLDAIKKCMSATVEETKRKTRTFWDDLLDEALRFGVEFALTNINSLLPDYLKVNVKVQRNFEDGSIVVSEFSVGKIVYNVKEETVTVDGDIFNPYINSGINEVNKLLPPFLQVSASELGLEVGEIVIRKKELQKDEQAEYRVRDDIIVVNGNATTYIQMRGSRFTLGNARELFVDKSIRKGLDELNKELPDLFQVSVRRDQEDNGRIFDSGPFSIKVEGKNAGLSVDRERLKRTIELLPDKLLNQVPAPLQPSARILWRQASIYIVEDILYSKETAARRKREKELKEQQIKETLALTYNSCKSNQPPVPSIPATKNYTVPLPPSPSFTKPTNTPVSRIVSPSAA